MEPNLIGKYPVFDYEDEKGLTKLNEISNNLEYARHNFFEVDEDGERKAIDIEVDPVNGNDRTGGGGSPFKTILAATHWVRLRAFPYEVNLLLKDGVHTLDDTLRINSIADRVNISGESKENTIISVADSVKVSAIQIARVESLYMHTFTVVFEGQTQHCFNFYGGKAYLREISVKHSGAGAGTLCRSSENGQISITQVDIDGAFNTALYAQRGSIIAASHITGKVNTGYLAENGVIMTAGATVTANTIKTEKYGGVVRGV